MKTPAYRSSITDVPNDDSNVLFGGTGINILVGSTGSDTVDYSILQEGSSIVANLVTGKVDTVVSKPTSVQLGTVGRYIRIYRIDMASDAQLTAPITARVYAGGVEVAPGKSQKWGSDSVTGEGGGGSGGFFYIKSYVELDLKGSCSIDSISLSGYSTGSNSLRVYVSNTPFPDYSTTAYADLAANASVARVDAVVVGAPSKTFTDTLIGIENLVGTAMADSLTGDGNANTLSGGAGNDTLAGGAGADIVNGGAGDDLIRQGMDRFADTLNGGNDTDTVDYSAAGTAGNIIANLATGKVAKVVAGVTFTDTLTGIENLVGTALADSLTGDGNANTLSGGSGKDTLAGGAGADIVNGGDGDDLIRQDMGRFADTLNGGNDNDTVDYSISGMAGSIVANLGTRGSGQGMVSKVLAGTSVSVGATGRYIRIYHTGVVSATQLLTLTGLKVYAGGVDVAAGKPSGAGADGGSVGGGSYNNPWALTDSAVGGAWNGGTRPSTSNLANVTGSKPYIELDLGSVRAIDSISLWGHTNAPANSNNLRVYVSNKSFAELTGSSPKTAYADLAANAGVARVDVAVVDTASSTTFTDTLTGIENLVGTALADSLTGDGNANTLSGGAGNDTLAGGMGSDTYLFGRGGGADVVQENDATAGNRDVLRLGASIDATQVWLGKVNNDLVLSLIGTSDRVTFAGWYTGLSTHVEEIYAGNKKLLDTNVDKLVSAMASFNPPAAGQTSLPANLQSTLQPVIAANWIAA